MKPQDYFIIGCKLFGIWCLFQGIIGLVGTIPTFFSPTTMDSNILDIYKATVIVNRLIPILYIICGIYLLKNSPFFYRFACSGTVEDISPLEEQFTIFVKMLGLYLLVIYITDLMQLISSWFVYSHAPVYVDMIKEKQYVYTNAASTITAVLLGFYLLKSGKIFIRLGFKSIEPRSDED